MNSLFGGRLARALMCVVALMAATWMGAADAVRNVPMAPGAEADIRLTVPGGRSPQGGFLPVKVRVANRGTREGKWELTLTYAAAVYSGGVKPGELRATHRFAVPAATTQEFFIYVPTLRQGASPGWAQLIGEISGPGTATDTFAMGLDYGWANAIGPVAAEPALIGSIRAMIEANEVARPTRSRSGGSVPAAVIDQAMGRVSEIDPAILPADWRAWSSFGVVALTTETWQKLDTARRQALVEAVSLGGTLLLVPSARGDAKTELIGAGQIVTLDAPLTKFSQQNFRIPSGGLLGVGLDKLPPWLAVDFFNEVSPRDWETSGGRGWLTVYIIAFGFVIGPVNFFLLAPAGRRHRLFLTVPLLSLLGAGGLLVTIFMSDGLGGEGARRALVELVPARNQALVFQHQVSRTGMLGGRRFALAADVWIERKSDDASSGPNVLLRAEDEAAGDWFVSRATQTHALRRIWPTRENVEIVGRTPEGAPVVQSTVAATLREFGFYEANGKYWRAEEVPPGVKVTLQPAADAAAASRVTRYLTLGGWRPGSFVARAGSDADAVLIPTLTSVRWRDDVVLYTGPLEPAAKP